MTENISNWFVPKFEESVKHASQQMTSRLGDTVAGGGTFVGDKVYFPRLDAVEAYDSPAFGQMVLANANQDFIEITTQPKFVASGLWDPHKHKYSVATAVEYGRAAAAAIRRAEDRAIIAALNEAGTVGVKKIGSSSATAIATIGSYADTPTMDLVAEAVAILGENEAFDGEDVTIVTPWRAKVQFALDPLMNKSDVKSNLPWNDLNWRHSGLLPGNNDGGVDLYVYAKSAVVSAYNDEPTSIDERAGGSLTDIKGYYVQSGAAPRAHDGIVRIKAKKSFTLSRYPTPIMEIT